MKTAAYEGVFVALVPQRGQALVDLLREACQQFLRDRDPRPWSIEFGMLASPAGAVVFRLTAKEGHFPWREGGHQELAKLVSKLAPGRCWAMAYEKSEGQDGWAEGIGFDLGERTVFEECNGGAAEIAAWFGEQLSLSENQVNALFESCDQSAGVLAGEEKFEDEIDQLLEKARREFQRYRELKEQREKGERG